MHGGLDGPLSDVALNLLKRFVIFKADTKAL